MPVVEQGQARQLKFERLPGRFAICRLAADAAVPEWSGQGDFISITRTKDELSLVCPIEQVPVPLRPEVPWVGLKLQGPFPFSETGILSSFIAPLAESKVPVFSISTFDTDYVFVQENFLAQAIAVLKEAGHQLG